eukprot:scaffold513_cov169-Amphora_coffeaeformis.AAC.4
MATGPSSIDTAWYLICVVGFGLIRLYRRERAAFYIFTMKSLCSRCERTIRTSGTAFKRK